MSNQLRSIVEASINELTLLFEEYGVRYFIFISRLPQTCRQFRICGSLLLICAPLMIEYHFAFSN